MRELKPLSKTVAALLIARCQTVSESAAGGLISAALFAVPAASACFVGGEVIGTRAGACCGSPRRSPASAVPPKTMRGWVRPGRERGGRADRQPLRRRLGPCLLRGRRSDRALSDDQDRRRRPRGQHVGLRQGGVRPAGDRLPAPRFRYRSPGGGAVGRRCSTGAARPSARCPRWRARRSAPALMRAHPGLLPGNRVRRACADWLRRGDPRRPRRPARMDARPRLRGLWTDAPSQGEPAAIRTRRFRAMKTAWSGFRGWAIFESAAIGSWPCALKTLGTTARSGRRDS